MKTPVRRASGTAQLNCTECTRHAIDLKLHALPYLRVLGHKSSAVASRNVVPKPNRDFSPSVKDFQREIALKSVVTGGPWYLAGACLRYQPG